MASTAARGRMRGTGRDQAFGVRPRDPVPPAQPAALSAADPAAHASPPGGRAQVRTAPGISAVAWGTRAEVDVTLIALAQSSGIPEDILLKLRDYPASPVFP